MQTNGFTWWQWSIILILHLLLLAWIVYLLQNTNLLSLTEVMIHFTGIALFGAGLIRFCAFLAYKRYKNENND